MWRIFSPKCHILSWFPPDKSLCNWMNFAHQVPKKSNYCLTLQKYDHFWDVYVTSKWYSRNKVNFWKGGVAQWTVSKKWSVHTGRTDDSNAKVISTIEIWIALLHSRKEARVKITELLNKVSELTHGMIFRTLCVIVSLEGKYLHWKSTFCFWLPFFLVFNW